MKWILRSILLLAIGYAGFAAYDYNRAGYGSLPDLPDGAYIFSFKNGFRGIFHDIEVTNDTHAAGPAPLRTMSRANPDRRYLGVPMEVASWFNDVWSTCRTASDDEKAYLANTMPDDLKQTLIGARLDGVCLITVDDGTEIMRGLVYSAPRL